MLGDKLVGGAEARNRQSRRNLKLSLRGNVEKQAQYALHQLNNLRAESDEDRLARPGSAEEAESRIGGEPIGR